jgi:hypothetical protein
LYRFSVALCCFPTTPWLLRFHFRLLSYLVLFLFLQFTGASTRIIGASTGFSLGSSVAFGGDLDGDGYSDIIVSSPKYDSNKGAVYFFSSSIFNINVNVAPATVLIDLATYSIMSSYAMKFVGLESNAYVGWSVDTRGDWNGDNIQDLLISAYLANSGNGVVYILYGSRSTPFPTLVSTATIGNRGMAIFGTSGYPNFGTVVTSGGDVNGDGINDYLINAGPSATYLFYGNKTRNTVDLGLSTAFTSEQG